jgi:hypothetical protein
MKSRILLLGVASLAMPAFADPGFVALEGSDATAFHHDAQYTPQLFHYLQGASSKDVLVYNPAGVIDLSGISGGVGTTNVTDLTGVDLSNYSALYIESPGGCCQADNTVLNGFGAAVKAFIDAGGNLSIENYVGGDYDGVVVGGSNPDGSIEGFGVSNGGIGGGPECTDGEVVTPLGIAKGFSQPPVDGCWSHQAYELSYWAPLGYVDLIHSSPEFTFADGGHDGSSFLALGGTLGNPHPGVPEPASWAMFIGGFGLIGGAMRHRRRSIVRFV